MYILVVGCVQRDSKSIVGMRVFSCIGSMDRVERGVAAAVALGCAAGRRADPRPPNLYANGVTLYPSGPRFC